MPASPWKSFGKVDPEKEYIIQITYLPLKSFWKILKFFRLTLAVQRQREDSPGLIGYSMQARIFSHRFWTLSSWESTKDISNFIVRMPHSKAMQDLKNDMCRTKFARWPAKGSLLPPDWEEAIKQLASV